MTRLTFKKQGTSYFTKELIAREKVVQGKVEMLVNNTYEFSVKDLGNDNVLHSGVVSRFTDAKGLTKRSLKALGVLFNDEVRKKLE